jgi:diaminopimelate decarboxylase
MHHFHYRNGTLYAEDLPVEEIAQKVGTPFYLYSYRTLTRHYKVFDEALFDLKHLICYSVKANSNLAILRIFAKHGAGADVVSGGEIFRAKKAGIESKKIVFSGVGKTEEEILYGLREDILMFNVESRDEFQFLKSLASKIGRKVPISFRVNPDIDPHTHPYISTGLKTSKFGIEVEEALNLYSEAKESKQVQLLGISCHIGSQITEIGPFIEAFEKIKELYQILTQKGCEIPYVDLGGGLGITYKDELPPHPREYSRSLIERAKGMDCTFIFEPGRVLVGNAGILVTKVLYRKRNGGREFVIVDAGMNDLIRPSLYRAYHEIWPVRREERPIIKANIVGPVCETTDFFAQEREIQDVKPGELLAIMGAGAYGFSMSSNYNSRVRAAEVLVKDDQMWIIRKRETYEDLIRGESIPEFLND